MLWLVIVVVFICVVFWRRIGGVYVGLVWEIVVFRGRDVLFVFGFVIGIGS